MMEDFLQGRALNQVLKEMMVSERQGKTWEEKKEFLYPD